MLRPARRHPAAVTFQGAPTSAPSPRSHAPGQGEALSGARFSRSRRQARRPGGRVTASCHHWSLCSLAVLVTGAGCAAPCLAAAPEPGRLAGRVAGRPCPEGAKRLGAREVEPVGRPLCVSSWCWFPGPNPGLPLPMRGVPGLEESWRETVPGSSLGGGERGDSVQSRLRGSFL